MPEANNSGKLCDVTMRKASGNVVSSPWPRARKMVRLLNWGYLVSILLLFFILPGCGERNWITGSLLYLPTSTALLPLLVLTPLCWFWHRRLCWSHLAVVALLFFLYQRPHLSLPGKGGANAIRVVTNNVGQRKPHSVNPFVQAEKADIIAMQEATHRQGSLRTEFPDKYVAVQGEFALISRWPIKHVGYVPGIFSHWDYAAAWFEIERNGQSIVIYNVHMPTPRPEFFKLRGRGFLNELTKGGGIYSSSVREDYSKAMQDRVEDCRKLMEVLKAESRPFIAIGDFNMPSTGYLHGVVASELTDVFAAKGNGYGLTFPGLTWNPLSLFGPWLRIDYIFTSKQWRPLNCEVEPRQNAQHLAVGAELELLNEK